MCIIFRSLVRVSARSAGKLVSRNLPQLAHASGSERSFCNQFRNRSIASQGTGTALAAVGSCYNIVMAASTGSIQGPNHTNRLATEESPYLLQHAHNPVDWYPWGEEAFEKAKAEDKPIFLSVGYSTCHWCHVMERESFENEDVATLLNDKFVAIKVDREERPDVDKVYMTYVQATSGGGGWPMSVFLTPELEPILGGTYFPPEDAYGRPGFKTVLDKVANVWQNQARALREQGAEVMKAISEAVGSQESERAGNLGMKTAREAIQQAYEQLARNFDRQNGGFSTAPKFPRVSEVNLMLLQHYLSTAGKQKAQAEKSLHMAELTLQKMAAGGIYDHIGGGFSRYSVDERWHVPHFEKMLYDNPQIVQAYLDAFRTTGNPDYDKVVRGVLDYLLRDMRHPGGAFFSAEDADSLEYTDGEKKEGAFYIWSKAEIDEVLGGEHSEQARLFTDFYSVRPSGNAVLSPHSDPHGEFEGKNILINQKPLTGNTQHKEQLLADAREKLHKRRSKRPRPHLDDKIVTGWNGFAIGALAAAARTLLAEDPPLGRLFPIDGRNPSEYLDAAIKAAEFVRNNLWSPETKLLTRSFCRGPSEVSAFDNDYAFLGSGLLDLYSASGDTQWLTWAQELQSTMDELFWDPQAGGYFSTTGADPSIKLRMKEDHDGAEPGASSIAVSNLMRLAALSTPEEAARLQERAAQTAAAFSERLEQVPVALTQMCCSLFLLTAGHMRQVIIAGKKGAEDTTAMLAAAHAVYCPDKVVILVDSSDAQDIAFWKHHNPSVLDMATGAKGSEATAFVCQNFACRAPTRDPEKLKALLADPTQSAATQSQGKAKLSSVSLEGLTTL